MAKIISTRFIWDRCVGCFLYMAFGLIAMLVVSVYFGNDLWAAGAGVFVSSAMGALNLFEPKYNLG